MNAANHGAFYTPPNIVKLIVTEALGRVCEGLTPDQMAGLAVLDPSCGEGAFLLGAMNYLIARGLSRDQALRCVYGVDVDKQALTRANSNIQLPTSNAKIGDSLLDFDWHRQFPEVLARGGFDAVIGNPPWLSLSGRFGVGAYAASQVKEIIKRFGGGDYAPNLFEYFILLGMELTRPGGCFSFIVPDRLAYNRHLIRLRGRLLKEGELCLLVHGIPFPGVVADTMVFVWRKGSPDSAVEVRDIGGLRSLHSQSDLLSNPNHTFPRPIDPETQRLVSRMEESGLRLRDICRITSGFGGKASLITPERISDTQIPVIKGRGIERYSVHKTHWFEFRDENITGRTVDPAKLGASPKVLIRKTGNSLIAAYDESGFYPEQSLYFLYDITDFHPLFLLGLLNSGVMNRYYQARCLTNRRTIAHVKKIDLDLLPIPSPDSESHDLIVRLVRERTAGNLDTCKLIDEAVAGLFGVR